MRTEVPVREIMTAKVITVQTTDTVTKVEDLWSTNPIHHLVVLDDGKVIGIVSKSDLMKAYGPNGAGIDNPDKALRVEDIMVSNPMVVEPDDTIGLVADIMLANKFHSLPVVEDGELKGIVTNHDLIKFFVR